MKLIYNSQYTEVNFTEPSPSERVPWLRVRVPLFLLATKMRQKMMWKFLFSQIFCLLVECYLRPYSQPFIFFVTYKWAQQTGVLYYSRPEKLREYTLGAVFTTLPFLCNLGPNKLECQITLGSKGLPVAKLYPLGAIRKLQRKCHVVNTPLGPYSQPFILFVTYQWPKKLECQITQGRKSLQGQKLQLIGPICKLQSKCRVVNTPLG